MGKYLRVKAGVVRCRTMSVAMQNIEHSKNAGIAMLNEGRHKEAIILLRQSIAIEPNDAKAHNCLGIAYQNTNDLGRAEESFMRAITLKPDYEGAYSNLVSVLERRSNIGQAREVIDRAKRLFPEGTLITLNEAIVLKREGRLEDAISLLTTGNYPQDPVTRLKVKHEMGLIYDRLDAVDEAFAQFADFNACAAQVFEITDRKKAVYLEKLERAGTVFSPEWAASWSQVPPQEEGDAPACLMGFVRSGTTLLQHILNAHPSVYASEEVHAFPIVEKEIRNNFTSYPECLAGFDETQIASLRRRYFGIHRHNPDWKDSKVLVDKYPMLANMAGLVHRLFPNEKYIFVQRHPCDCILSAYMQLFVPNDASVHFYDLDDAVNLYTRFMDLWAQYENTLPLNVHYVRYEDITADFNGAVRGVLDFLNVPWDEVISDYDQKVRQGANVISPSYEQVSEKIYNRATYRWLRYKHHLAPYLDRLAPYVERFGYDMGG